MPGELCNIFGVYFSDEGARARIQSALDRFHEETCIRFIPRINQPDYLHFVPKQG